MQIDAYWPNFYLLIFRYYAIVHPLKAQYLCTISKAKKTVLVTWTSAFLLAIPILWVQVSITCIAKFAKRTVKLFVLYCETSGFRLKIFWLFKINQPEPWIIISLSFLGGKRIAFNQIMKHRPTDKYKHVSRERPIKTLFNQKSMLDQVSWNFLQELLMLKK